MSRMNIAIDGPAGAGKSTVAGAVARRLGILHLDTGAMYRTLALKALRIGANPNIAAEVEPMLEDTDVQVVFRDGVQYFLLDGEDVTGLIRTPEVSKAASDIAVIPAVRLKLVELQRMIAGQYDVVMDGRDITTYVLPEAKYKFFITAASWVRAQRRLKELKEKDPFTTITLEELQAAIESRDRTDSNRAFAPLRQAEDAQLVDTTDLSVEQAVRAVLDRIEQG